MVGLPTPRQCAQWERKDTEERQACVWTLTYCMTLGRLYNLFGLLYSPVKIEIKKVYLMGFT